ncbi:MAG: hypothetical protein RIS45_434, partial [Planctomycetota bacterium]
MIAQALVVLAAHAAARADVAIPSEIKPLLAAHCVDCH